MTTGLKVVAVPTCRQLDGALPSRTVYHRRNLWTGTHIQTQRTAAIRCIILAATCDDHRAQSLMTTH